MVNRKRNSTPNLTLLNGGGERDRTDDLLRARQALSQLSYTPIHLTTELLSAWWA